MRILTLGGLFLLALMSACQSAPTRTIDSTVPVTGAAIREVTPAEALPD